MSSADKPRPAKSPISHAGRVEDQPVGSDDVTRPISTRPTGTSLLKGISEPPALAPLIADSSADAFDDKTLTDGIVVPPRLDRALSFEDQTLTDVVALEKARVLSASEPPPPPKKNVPQTLLAPVPTRPALPAEELSTSNLELIDNSPSHSPTAEVPAEPLSMSSIELEDAPPSSVSMSSAELEDAPPSSTGRVEELSTTDIVASAALVPDEPPTMPFLPADPVDSKDVLEASPSKPVAPKASIRPPVPKGASMPPPRLSDVPPLHKPEEISPDGPGPTEVKPRPALEPRKPARKSPPYALYAGAVFGVLVGVIFALSRPSATDGAEVTETVTTAKPDPTPVAKAPATSVVENTAAPSESALPASFTAPPPPAADIKPVATEAKPVTPAHAVQPVVKDDTSKPASTHAGAAQPKVAAATPAVEEPPAAPPPPPPPPVDSSRGIVYVGAQGGVVEVDGVPVRVNGNAVVLSCGKHKIKAGDGDARAIDVPCGGSVTF